MTNPVKAFSGLSVSKPSQKIGRIVGYDADGRAKVAVSGVISVSTISRRFPIGTEVIVGSDGRIVSRSEITSTVYWSD